MDLTSDVVRATTIARLARLQTIVGATTVADTDELVEQLGRRVTTDQERAAAEARLAKLSRIVDRQGHT